MTLAPKQGLVAAAIAFPTLLILRKLFDILGLKVYTWNDNLTLSGINAIVIAIAVLVFWRRRR